jgi:uncharacterized protein YegP (UPF0339 family)
MSARFEVVRTDAGHHARFVAKNGRIVWTTEVYTRRARAENAIESMTNRFIHWHEGKAYTSMPGGYIEVRYVDDRLKPMPRPELPAVGAP